MRSLFNKYPELSSHLSIIKRKFSFIILTETWLTDCKDVGFEFSGYKSFAVYRNQRIGGGIKIYYLDHITADMVSELSGCFPLHESLIIKAFIPGFGKLNVCGLYRIPSSTSDHFLSSLTDILSYTSSSRCFIGGDFNLNTLRNPCSQLCHDYTQLMNSFGYENFINDTTYVSPVSFSEVSCIDHIWSNITDLTTHGYVIKPNLSDHYPVCIMIDTYINPQTISIKFRNFSFENVEKFKFHVAQEFSVFNPSSTDVDTYSNEIARFLMRLSNKFFPIMTKQFSNKRLNSPWINDNILRCIRKKHVWYKLLSRNRITLMSYKNYCNALRNLLRIAEEEYYVSKLNSLKNDPKKNWRILNSLMGKNRDMISDNFQIDGEQVLDEAAIASSFSDYFISHPASIHASIPPPSMDFSHLITPNPRTMVFYHSTESELLHEISSMKNSGSLDDVPSLLLKLCKSNLSKFLSRLFNMCIDQGAYPEIFKIARITPVFKKGPRNLIQNHRPISILCNLSKIFDGLIHRRITSFFTKFNLLSDNQFGFRKNKNTELAI